MNTQDGRDVQRLFQIIAKNTQTIAQNAKQIEQSLQLFGTPKDTVVFREKTSELARTTDQIDKETGKNLKELLRYTAFINSDRQLKTTFEKLQDSYKRSSKIFQDSQRSLNEKKIQSANSATFSSINYSKSDQLIDIESQQSQNGFGMLDQRQQQLQEDERARAVEEQNRQLREIEQNIVDVNTIFKDLAVIVHEQGDIIDSIEQNVEATSNYVDSAKVELNSAVQYQSSARRKKIYLVIILLVVLLGIGLIIYFSIPKRK